MLQLHEVYSRVCSQRQVSAVGQSECLSLCSLLESRGIFALKKAKEARLTKVPTRQHAFVTFSSHLLLNGRVRVSLLHCLMFLQLGAVFKLRPHGCNAAVSSVSRVITERIIIFLPLMSLALQICPLSTGGAASLTDRRKVVGVCLSVMQLCERVCLLQVFLKIEERDVENALKDRTLLGSILTAGLPS